MSKKYLLILCIFMSCSTNKNNQYPISDHYNGKIFVNPWGSPLKSFWQVLKWKIFSDREDWPKNIENNKYPFSNIQNNEIAKITFINHASFLIQFGTLNILTDPIWSERASPVSFFGPKRVRSPGLSMVQLPKIDVILISHNHYDHLDIKTLEMIQKRDGSKIYVPLGDATWLKEKGITATELDWWEKLNFAELEIHFAPATHWSARGLNDKNHSLWGSYLIRSKLFSIYFAGDTGMGPHFQMIYDRFGSVDVALLPIGAYEPRDFMKNYHMNPAEAVEAMGILQAKQALGMHFGTFQLTDESYGRPVIDLKQSLKAANLSENVFRALDFGESVVFEK